MNKRQYLGFLGFVGFAGVGPLLRGDWLGASWLLWFIWFLYFVSSESRSGKMNTERSAEKEEQKERLLSVAQSKGTITNDEAQTLLGVSDSTAERYLEELEKVGKLAQVGTVGRAVTYKIL